MAPDPPTPPPDRPRNWGGRRAGAGAPRGPRPATIERQAAIHALFDDPHERALLRRISPLDIIEIAARRLLADGSLYAAAHLAALAVPYRHYRKRTIVTDLAGHPIEAPTPKPRGGVLPEPELADPDERKLVLDRIPRTGRKHKRRAREDAQPDPSPGAAPA